MNWIGLGLTLALVACTATGTKGQDDGAVAVPAGAEPLVEHARADLQARTGADANAIAVVEVTSVDWPDTSLGCPEPDRFYAQVIVSGYRIILGLDGRQHEYHTSTSSVVYCPEGTTQHAGGMDGTSP